MLFMISMMTTTSTAATTTTSTTTTTTATHLLSLIIILWSILVAMSQILFFFLILAEKRAPSCYFCVVMVMSLPTTRACKRLSFCLMSLSLPAYGAPVCWVVFISSSLWCSCLQSCLSSSLWCSCLQSCLYPLQPMVLLFAELSLSLPAYGAPVCWVVFISSSLCCSWLESWCCVVGSAGRGSIALIILLFLHKSIFSYLIS